MKKAKVPPIAFLVAISLHPLYSYILISKSMFGLSIIGTGIASSILKLNYFMYMNYIVST